MESQKYIKIADKEIFFNIGKADLEREVLNKAFPGLSFQSALDKTTPALKVKISVLSPDRLRKDLREFKDFKITAQHVESGLKFLFDGDNVILRFRDSGYAIVNKQKAEILFSIKTENDVKLIPDFLIQTAVLELLRENDFYFFHGSGILNKENNLITFSGDSGSGKSSLGYGLIKSGDYSFFSDDIILFNQSGEEVYPFIGEMKIPARILKGLNLGVDNRGHDEFSVKKKISLKLQEIPASVDLNCLILIKAPPNSKLKQPITEEASLMSAFEFMIKNSIIPTERSVTKNNFNALFNLLKRFKRIIYFYPVVELRTNLILLEEEIGL